MSISRVIYEHGITSQVIGFNWHMINIGSGRTEKIDNPGIIAQRYNVRPVVITQSEGTIDILLRTTVHDPFGIKIADWEQVRIIYQTLNLIRYLILRICFKPRSTIVNSWLYYTQWHVIE
jgi:hypothetical protein